jgi:hypothetical protein
LLRLLANQLALGGGDEPDRGGQQILPGQPILNVEDLVHPAVVGNDGFIKTIGFDSGFINAWEPWPL